MSQPQILINVLQCYTVKSLAQDTSETTVYSCAIWHNGTWYVIKENG